MSYSPWKDIGERYPEWVVRHAALRGGAIELLSWVDRVILLERARSIHQRRSDLAHAIAHLDLEHRAIFGRVSDWKEEAAANRLAVKRLIGIRSLADAWRWSGDLDEIAAELRVDVETVRIRTQHLAPYEREWLRRAEASRGTTP